MALSVGRLIPHGKHADLQRRAINSMGNRPPRTLRIKWGPSRVKEEDVRAGTITREHMEGNQEADKDSKKPEEE
eukprot:1625278-Heterocapsa_arctica.AAC.1